MNQAIVGLPSQIPQHRFTFCAICSCRAELLNNPELLAMSRRVLLVFAVCEAPAESRLTNPGVANEDNFRGGLPR